MHRFYQALQQCDYDTLTGMFHPDFVFYPQIDSPRPGAAGFIDAEKKHVDAFSGIRLTVLDTVAEADKVGAYVAVEGDQGGDYYGIPPPPPGRAPGFCHVEGGRLQVREVLREGGPR
ncbi:ester cyclase, partial [Streptomyces sp. NPDC016626]|uniref:ester cyclase n=1 Tax=Streptomyces sp. NPDC016626 TaxID=3364968 RepID=UPI0036FCA510